MVDTASAYWRAKKEMKYADYMYMNGKEDDKIPPENKQLLFQK